jgi:hypothetical protein
MYSIIPHLRAVCTGENEPNILKISLRSTAVNTVWTEMGSITAKNIYTCLSEIDFISAEEAGERWKKTNVCCVAGIAQNIKNAKKYILVLLPDLGTPGNLSCSHQLVPFEPPFKIPLCDKNLMDVVGVCENMSLSENQALSDKWNVYPLHQVIFITHPHIINDSSSETTWDLSMSRNKPPGRNTVQTANINSSFVRYYLIKYYFVTSKT